MGKLGKPVRNSPSKRKWWQWKGMEVLGFIYFGDTVIRFAGGREMGNEREQYQEWFTDFWLKLDKWQCHNKVNGKN